MCETKSNTTNYEKTTCTRCGGSGSYSFNLMHGSMCYGCQGSGKKLTKRGRAALEHANSLLDTTVGEFAKLQGRKARWTDSFAGKRYTFSAVEETGVQTGRSLKGGKMVPWERKTYALMTSKGQRLITLDEGMKVRLIPTQADIDAINDYQANLTKAGTPRKRQAA